MLTLQIIGKKKSGKTTTMINFIQASQQLGLKTAAFKHTHHSVAMDVAGTDTARFSEAGADQVGMQQDGGFFWHEVRQPEKKVLLATEINDFVRPQTDLVLIEGFKWEKYPKLLLLRPQDEVADFSKFGPFDYVGTIFPENRGAKLIDLTSKEKSQTWFENWVKEQEQRQMNNELTHFNEQERAKMVDVTDKKVNYRMATAQATVKMTKETLQRIKAGQVKKGDVLAVAQVAGIMAAKKTSELIPMCHLLLLSGVDILFTDNEVDTLTIQATVKVNGQTGVEMEALTACQITALTVYDMCKAMDKNMVITDCHLVEKIGGKSGHYTKQ